MRFTNHIHDAYGPAGPSADDGPGSSDMMGFPNGGWEGRPRLRFNVSMPSDGLHGDDEAGLRLKYVLWGP